MTAVDPLVRLMDRTTIGDGCWLWTGVPQSSGYAQVGIGRHGKALGHRVVYEHFRGPIPDEMEIDHTCNVRTCLRPDHLQAVSHQENQRRRGMRVTHFPCGHERVAANAWRGGGQCKHCRNAKRRKG